jgi:hypothetical protein
MSLMGVNTPIFPLSEALPVLIKALKNVRFWTPKRFFLLEA